MSRSCRFHEKTQYIRPKVKKIITYTSASTSNDFACSVDDPALTKVLAPTHYLGMQSDPLIINR